MLTYLGPSMWISQEICKYGNMEICVRCQFQRWQIRYRDPPFFKQFSIENFSHSVSLISVPEILDKTLNSLPLAWTYVCPNASWRAFRHILLIKKPYSACSLIASSADCSALCFKVVGFWGERFERLIRLPVQWREPGPDWGAPKREFLDW